jgi:sterol desaturase/sphingolipid hydroxylase (fatty acid hydroxylase superfamily)
MSVAQLDYVRSAVTLGSLALLLSLETWVPYFEGRTARTRHAARNLSLALFNAAVVILLFAGPLARVSEWSARRPFGLLNWLSLPPGVRFAGAIVFFDAWMYGWHRANHRVHFLWRFHRMHHSERDLDATTALRFHTGEIFMSTVLRLGVLALLGMSVSMLIVYEMALAPVIQFHHSNVRIPPRLDRALRTLIVSPNMHRVDHSEDRWEHDGNYASIFSFWDRLFNSYRRRKNPKELMIGLPQFRDLEWLGLLGMLKTPVR